MPLVLQQYLDVAFETKPQWEQTPIVVSSDNLQPRFSVFKQGITVWKYALSILLKAYGMPSDVLIAL